MLNASNDPNKEIGPYEASAYPVAPLQANTTYNVAINGTPFSRNFSFTTGPCSKTTAPGWRQSVAV